MEGSYFATRNCKFSHANNISVSQAPQHQFFLLNPISLSGGRVSAGIKNRICNFEFKPKKKKKKKKEKKIKNTQITT